MTNAPKKKGTAAEVAVVAFLRENGYPHAERRALAGVNDRGDVAGIPGLVIEVKSCAEIKLAAWVDEAYAETRPPVQGVRVEEGVVWHKRRSKASPGQWYVTMDGWTFLEFLKEWTA